MKHIRLKNILKSNAYTHTKIKNPINRGKTLIKYREI